MTPDALGRTELRFNLAHDGLNGLQVLGVASERAVCQREAVFGYDQGHDNLLAVATVIARVSSLGQLVFGRQSLEVGTREVVEYQAVIESKQRAQLFLEIALDRLLSSEQLIEGSIQTILGDKRYREYPRRSSRPVDAYQCSASRKFRAR